MAVSTSFHPADYTYRNNMLTLLKAFLSVVGMHCFKTELITFADRNIAHCALHSTFCTGPERYSGNMMFWTIWYRTL